ncbi:MAG: LptF/LptG family permease [Planctomycetota bacterium]
MRFQLYILRQVLGAFGFAVAALLFVALPGIVVSAVHKLPNVEPALLLHFLPLVLEGIAPYVLPVCFMLAVVAVYGRLAADREWIAMQMSGLWPVKLLVPPLLVATVLAAATFWMVSEELPRLKERQKRFLIEAAASVIENLQPGRTSISLGDFYLKASDRDESTGTFYDAYIRMPEGKSVQGDVFASTVDIRIGESKLYGRLTDWEAFEPRSGISTGGTEIEFEVNLADSLGRETRDWSRPRYRPSTEIVRAFRSGLVKPENRREFVYELHRRAALAAAFFLFLGLGAPTGLLMRRGTQLGALAVAAGYGILYYVFSVRIGWELGFNEALPVWFGPWITTILGLVVAFFLLKKAIRR